tara:strand:+ start:17 stop:655 length:639 start_codon:yes stop_codon:yes gene_type:complete
MGLNLKAEGNDFETLSAGQHLGVCYRIVDLGTREEQYKENPPKKRTLIHVTWETQEELMEDGRPFATGRSYTASLNENATFYKDLVTWRGKPFSEEELKGFDVSKMLGVPANIHIEHNDDGKPRIKNIFKPDNFKRTPTINAAFVFDLDIYCNEFNGNSSDETKAMCDIFAELPEWQRNLIEDSYEYLAANDGATPVEEDVVDPDFDDDIPF